MSKETFVGSAIRHLVTHPRSDLFLAALFEKTVYVWNLKTGKSVSEFQTILDGGMFRLAFSHQESACLAAAYYDEGLACYEVPSGEVRWRRKDIRKIQQIAVTSDGLFAYCCFSEGPCQLISIPTGQTVDELPEILSVWVDAISGYQLRTHLEIELWSFGNDLMHTIEPPPNNFGLLSATFIDNYFAYSQPCEGFRVFEITSGKEVFEYDPPAGSHVLDMSAYQRKPLFHFIQWNYMKGGPRLLLRAGEGLDEEVVKIIPFSPATSFCNDGQHLLCSSGELIDCMSGEVIRRFEFPVTKYNK